MNLAALGLAGEYVAQESDELRAGMARSSLAYDIASGGVQYSKQAERAIALVFKAMAPILAVERLRPS
jgi:hypothetical protein